MEKIGNQLSNRVVFLLLLALGLLAFGLAVWNGFLGDDGNLFVDNVTAHSIANVGVFFSGGSFNSGGAAKLSGFYYKPLLLTVLSTIYTLFGPNAGVFHFSQILLHCLNGLLLFALLKKFFSRMVAFLLSAVFLVHPANVEAVVYVSGFQEPLFLFFGMLAVLVRVYFPVNWRSSLFVGVMLLFSLLSKETGILFLGLIFVYDWLFDSKRTLLSDAKITGVVVSTYAFLRFVVGGVFFNNHSVAPIMAVGIWGRLVMLPKIFLVNLETIFFPRELAFAQNWLVSELSWNDFWWPVAASTIFFIGWLFLWFKVVGKTEKRWLFFSGWFAIGIFLHLQIFPLDGTFSERWLYFPLIGITGMLGVLLEKMREKTTFRLVIGFMVIVVFLFVVRDVARVPEWKDQFGLYLADSEKRGGNFILYSGLAQEYIVRNDLARAESYAKRSIAIFPTFLNTNNLGVVYSKTGRYDQAVAEFQKSLAFGPYYLAYENMVGTLLLWEKNEQAIAVSEEGMRFFPGNSRLLIFWTTAQYRVGHLPEALDGASRALQMNPSPASQYLWQAVNRGEEIKLGN